MKKILLTLVCLFLFQNYVSADTVTVPAGTVIPLAYTQKILGKKVQVDDKLPIYVIKDVVINGQVVFPQNSQGYLNVFDVKVSQYWKPGHYDGKGGYIEIDGGAIQDINGKMREINYQDKIVGKDSDSYSVAQGMYMNSNYYAQNPIIRQGQRFKVVTDNEFKIDIKNEGI